MRMWMTILMISSLLALFLPESHAGDTLGCRPAHVSAIKRTIHRFLDASLRFEIDASHCHSNWAVVSGTLGPNPTPKPGPQGAPTSFVLRKHHVWKLLSKAQVCGTYEPSKPERYPPDAQVPRALYREACLAG